MNSINTENHFPRGRSIDQKVNNKLNGNKVKKYDISSDEQLFKVHKRKANKNDSKTKKKKSKNNEEEYEEKTEKVIIESMTLSRLPEGINIYGCIQEISDFDIKLCICGGIVVKVSITHISDPYTQLLESFAQNPESLMSSDVEVLKPSGMFQIGQHFPIKILNKTISDKGFATVDITASLNPRDIYSDLMPSHLFKIPKLPIVAAVESIEDHGFVMNVGLNGVKAFLSKDKAQNAIQSLKGRNSLSVGQLVLCAIESVANERSITLTTKAKTLSNFKLTSDTDVILSCLIPGLTVSATVMNVNEKGLELNILNDFSGFVTRNHLKTDWDLPKNVYSIGDQIEGTILYTHPNTKQIALSIKPKLDLKAIKRLKLNMKIGSIHENAVVMGRDDLGNMVFRLANNVKAIAPKKHLTEINTNDLEDFDFETKFAIGSAHKCRVISINLMDSLVVVTLRESLLDSAIVSLEDLEIGSIIKGTVKQINKFGVWVQIGFGLKGFIPNIHLADVPHITQREQLFPNGKLVKCRITKIETDSTRSKVSLTCKKSLLSKKLNILRSYEDAIPGFQTDGVVALIHKKGLLVEFFNGVKGFIPIKFLSSYRIEYPEKVFKVGQIVRCSVVSTIIEKERMTCSLINIKGTNKSSNSTVGQLLKQMKILNKSENGFDLINESTKDTAFIPFGHLSDDIELIPILREALTVGDIIDEVVVFTIKGSLVIVTKKLIFINAAKEDKLVSSFEQLEPNIIVPAIINGFATYGIFIELPGNIKGLVPKRYLIDGPIDEPNKLGFALQQTVFARFIEFEDEINEDKKQRKKLAFSLKLSHVWDHQFEDRVNMFNNYMNDFQYAKKAMLRNKCDINKALLKLEIGQIVNYRVVEVNDFQIISDVTLENNKKFQPLKGISRKLESDLERDIKVGSTGIAVIVNIDFDDICVELMLRQKLVKQVKNSLKINAISSLKLEQVIKCTALYMCEKYILVILGGHAPGVLAFIPSKRHINDKTGISSLFTLDECYHVVIKSVTDSRVVAVLRSEPNKSKLNKVLPEFKVNKAKDKQQKEDITESKEDITENNQLIDSKKEMKRDHKKDNKISKILKSEKEKKIKGEEISEPKVVSLKDNSTSESISCEPKSKKRDFLKVEEGFRWNVEEATPNLNSLTSLITKDSSSDSDSNESDSEVKNTKRKKTRSERNEEVRHREELLRKREEMLMNTDRKPETVDDFEISVLASPNSSLVWLKYMAFHLEQAEITKARAVGERALKTISFREEQEKLNVWFALLNLENLYGTQASLEELFQRALQFNEQIVIYNHLANVYSQSNKSELTEALYNTMLKKFKHNKTVWINFGLYYIKNNRLESSRKLMQRSLMCLEKRDHIDVISKFAQMEFKWGDVEHGKTLFENILSNFPKRVDLWSVYIDMMCKYVIKENNKESEDSVRNIFERVITFKLAAKQMKFIFKRYIQFEKQYNNEDRIDRIKQKALEYVESKTII